MPRSCPCLLVLVALVACSSGAPPATTSAEGEASGDEARAAGEGAAEESAQPAEPAVEPAVEPAATGDAAPTGARMEGGFFVAEGAPPPTACVAASDCVANTLPAAGGCCNAHHPIVAHSRAYAAWLGTWRGARCADVSCPPPPPPARPADCHFALRCEAAQCRDACGD